MTKGCGQPPWTVPDARPGSRWHVLHVILKREDRTVFNFDLETEDEIRSALLASADTQLESQVANQHFGSGGMGRLGDCRVCTNHATCGGSSRVFARPSELLVGLAS